MELKTITCYIAARLREASTWQALVLLLTAVGAKLSEDEKAAIVTAGLALAGFLGMVFPDRLGKQETRSTDQGETK